jgi:hypothetical protein
MGPGLPESEMSNVDLPVDKVLNRAFQERGRDEVVKIDVFPIKDGELIKLKFEGKTSPWRQGVWVRTDRGVVINHQLCVSAQLWNDTADKEILIECRTENGRLHLYNIWDRGRGSESQSWSSGMLIQELTNGRRYRCNDIGFETDFSKLVFTVEKVSDSASEP